jgi:palmitoyltransferase
MAEDGAQPKKERKEPKKLSEIVAESNAKRRAKRRREGPQPWIILKFAVFLTSAIIIYTCYVYIGRFLVPMLEQSDKALASRATGSECS